MRTADPDLHETFAPLREVEPTPEEIARVLGAADELRSPRSLARPRRRAGRAVALVAATAAVIGAHRGPARRRDARRPQDAHGVLQAAAAVAAQQPGARRLSLHARAGALRLRRQRARRPARPRDRAADLGELDLRRLARTDHRRRAAPPRGPSPPEPRAAGGGAATSARSSRPTTATTATATARWRACPSPRSPRRRRRRRAARGRDPRRALAARPPTPHPHWAPGVVESEVARSAVLLLAMGNLDERPAPGAVRAARLAPGRPLAGRGHRRDRAQGRRRRAAPARLRRRAARDHRPRDERHPAELGGHGPAAGQPAQAPGGRAQAAVASAGVAGRAHPGLPEHGQRRRAGGAAVASGVVARGLRITRASRDARAALDASDAASSRRPPDDAVGRAAPRDLRRPRGSGGVASKCSTPPETTARAPSPTSSAPSSPSARMSSRRAGARPHRPPVAASASRRTMSRASAGGRSAR